MKPADLVVIVALAAAVGAAAAGFWQSGGAATEAQIRIAGGAPQTVTLMQAQTLTVPGHLGASVIRIEPGRLRFIDSPCRNRVCVHRGWMSTRGDSAACLPNRISVTLSGEGPGALDAIHQ